MNITQRIILITLTLAITACNSTPDSRCEQYQRTYAAYQLSTTVREPSKEELDYAHAAAAFLTLRCGWVKTKGTDQYGVPIIVKGAR